MCQVSPHLSNLLRREVCFWNRTSRSSATTRKSRRPSNLVADDYPAQLLWLEYVLEIKHDLRLLNDRRAVEKPEDRL
jgi:hypothetical protein